MKNCESCNKKVEKNESDFPLQSVYLPPPPHPHLSLSQKHVKVVGKVSGAAKRASSRKLGSGPGRGRKLTDVLVHTHTHTAEDRR